MVWKNPTPVKRITVTCDQCGKMFVVKDLFLMTPKHCWSCSNKWEKLQHLMGFAIVS